MTFDEVLPAINETFSTHMDLLGDLDWLLINRDLYGRIRLIAPEFRREKQEEAQKKQDEKRQALERLAAAMAERLGPHAYPPGARILYEPAREIACQGAASFPFEGHDNVWVVDRLATEGNWTHIAAETEEGRPPRIVFFSIKGGVGRSTGLAATAWWLAQKGKRVLVLDLDLESPGLSTNLLPRERQPMYGIIDWLVEDLVDNADAVFDDMTATSLLSREGEIYVVPSHGENPGEYVAKLGRVWMPKITQDGEREPWSKRLNRLLGALEERIKPDVLLIDSRAGIDEVASAWVSDLGANLVLLFSLEGRQTWSGYQILFEHWRRAGVAQQIRERLNVVAALVPELDRIAYLKEFRDHAYQLFVDKLYDEIAPAPIAQETIGERKIWRVGAYVEGWNFDEADEGAPHYPWEVNWHRSFAGLRSLDGRLAAIDAQEVQSIFGPLIKGIARVLNVEDPND